VYGPLGDEDAFALVDETIHITDPNQAVPRTTIQCSLRCR
jgi:hypothetical protein